MADIEVNQAGAEMIGEGALSLTTLQDEAARLKQSLLDLRLSEATGLSLVHCPSAGRQETLVRDLASVATDAKFVVCHLSLEQYPLDALSAVVAAVLDGLKAPQDKRPVGLLGLLGRYDEKHGRKAFQNLSEAFEEQGLSSDLSAFCLAYLNAAGSAEMEVKAFSEWAEGLLSASATQWGVRGVLNDKTAQRVLADLTRIILALGHSGTMILLSRGEIIARRTERQRERAYTVLREFVDNFDVGHGCLSTKLFVTGGDELFVGEKSLQSLGALMTRLGVPSAAEPPPPHRTWTSLIKEPYEYVHRAVRSPEKLRPAHLRSLIRVSQGLPPTEAVTSMSVGHEKIDRTIDQLFAHAEMAGSVFQVLSGEYGSGKTHIMLHLAERALSQGHPVFWLNLERMNLDLGNPQRHLHRVLSQSVLPKKGRPSALTRARAWTRSAIKLKRLASALEEVSRMEGTEALAARRALQLFDGADDVGQRVEDYLVAEDLKERGSSAGYRADAYRRLLLWCELLKILDGAAGPVILIDEAENLYTSGLARNVRRSALRTLSFYCGGSVPGACVLLAMTPNTFVEMRKECKTLLSELNQVGSTLDIEDVDLFRRRLGKLEPNVVPEFSRKMRKELAEKVRRTHRSVRGAVEMDDWEDVVSHVARSASSPRQVVRELIDRLEASWWAGS